MKILTVRGVNDDLSIAIKKAAREESLSVNQYIVNLLKKQFGKAKEKKFTKKYNDLDSLFGQWSEQEYDGFKDELELQRQIDPELWQ